MTFKTLLHIKREEIMALKNRYLTGLEKLEFAASQVSIMQKELSDLQPELVKTSADTEKLMIKIEQDTVEVEAKKEVRSLCCHWCSCPSGSCHEYCCHGYCSHGHVAKYIFTTNRMLIIYLLMYLSRKLVTISLRLLLQMKPLLTRPQALLRPLKTNAKVTWPKLCLLLKLLLKHWIPLNPVTYPWSSL